MLEVLNLTKIFKSKKKETNIALNNVSFKLPDTGLVFVTGKSGSGKTTLLSLIGGLEDVTSGEIIYHGNKLSEFKHSEFDVYRNNEVGFIFQDYHLLEELSIFDNIKMMLDFKCIKDDEKIFKALEAVGLKGYENRFPKELSGGEKQRVAIARILVKDPSIILADEPTGNLDKDTTKQILDLLKEISKNKLVLIVSHNKYDAYNYGDYILKLDNGQIIDKVKRNESNNTKYHIENNILYLSKDKNITKEEKETLLNDLKSEKIKDFRYNESIFENYDENFSENKTQFKDKKKHISFLNSLKYSFKFAKRSIFKILISSFVIATIVSLSSLCNHMYSMNENEIRENYYLKTDIDFAETKNSLIFNFIGDDYKNEIAKIKGLKSYEVYPALYESTNLLHLSNKANTIDDFVPKVLIADEQFLIDKFGINNKVEFVAKNPIQNEYGFYITDEFLSYQNLKNLDEKIIQETFNNGIGDFKINGIIKTDLNARFSKILAKVDKFNPNSKKLSYSEEGKYVDYLNEFELLHLNLITFNIDAYNHYLCQKNFHYLPNGIYMKNGLTKEFKSAFSDEKNVPLETNLSNDELIIRYDNYENITGKKFDYKKQHYYLDEPFELNLKFYNSFDFNKKHCLLEKTFKVVGASTYGNYVNSENYFELVTKLNPARNILFLNLDKIQELSKINEKYNYEFIGSNESSIFRIGRAIEPLKELFEFLTIVLTMVFIFIVLFNFTKMFNNSLFETGVMKALGARDVDIVNMMFVHFIANLGLTLIFFNVLEPIISKFTSDVLISGIGNLVTLAIFQSGVNLIPFNYLYFIFANLIIILTFIMAFLPQFIRIRRLKPVNIIKAKE